MANIAKDGTPSILASVDRADDGSPQRLMLSIDLTAEPVLSSTHRSRLLANTGGFRTVKIAGIGEIQFNISGGVRIPDSELDEVGRKSLAASRSKRGGRTVEEL